MKAAILFGRVAAAALTAALAGCGGQGGVERIRKVVITDSGSDTMVNLAQMWAEEYRQVKPGVSVEVAGGGSGVGIRDLMQGIVDIANCSRDITASEREQIRQSTGKEPVEWIVGYDAIAVYAHKDSPVNKLSIGQLAGIFGEGGTIDRWSQLGVEPASVGGNDEIVRISRQNSSGTYFYFREHVLQNKDFKLGSRDMSGSKDVVELVGKTKGAIGYSGMGYVTDAVKFIKVSPSEESEGVAPSVENVASGTYPLARALYMYTLGMPEGETKAYLDWILSEAGQRVVAESGYVPVAAGKK